MVLPLIGSLASKFIWNRAKNMMSQKKKTGAAAAGTASKPKSFSVLGALDWVVYGIFPFLIFLFFVLIFSGCLGTSPGIPNLYLVSLTEKNLSISVGYFGMCFARTNNTIGLACGSTFGLTADEIASRVLKASADIPSATPLIGIAKDLQRDILAPLFPAVCIAFVGALASLGGLWYLCSRGNTSEPMYWRLRRAALALLFAGVALALMSSLATTQTVAAVKWGVTAVHDGVQGVSRSAGRGQAVEALQWTTAVLMAIFAVRLAFVYRHPTSAAAQAPDVEMGTREEYRADGRRPSSIYSR